MYPAFSIVTIAENGLVGSTGSETVAVTRGNNVTTATIPPNKVANARTKPSGDILRFSMVAFFCCFFGSTRFVLFFDIVPIV
jgi:hypothetical protein